MLGFGYNCMFYILLILQRLTKKLTNIYTFSIFLLYRNAKKMFDFKWPPINQNYLRVYVISCLKDEKKIQKQKKLHRLGIHFKEENMNVFVIQRNIFVRNATTTQTIMKQQLSVFLQTSYSAKVCCSLPK